MNKILLLIKTPPPFTGVTFINQSIAESKKINENFSLKTINISYARNTKDLGYFSFKKLFIYFSIMLRLLARLVLFKPNLVYLQITPTNFAFIRDAILVMIIKVFRKKIIFHLHGKGIQTACKSKSYLKTIYIATFNKTSVISLSEKLYGDVKEIHNGKSYIVNNGIKYFNRSLDKKNINIHLLFLSNIFHSKGIVEYLDALSLLNKKGIQFKGLIVGSEGDISNAELNSLIKLKGLDKNITYLGPMFELEKIDVLNNADVLVHPTKNDAFPLVLLEAMQLGLPIVSTYEGAIPEIVDDGVTGFLVEKQNPQALAEKIEILIKDKELREKMGEAGRKKFLEKYTLDIFEKNMKDVFDQVLRGIE